MKSRVCRFFLHNKGLGTTSRPGLILHFFSIFHSIVTFPAYLCFTTRYDVYDLMAQIEHFPSQVRSLCLHFDVQAIYYFPLLYFPLSFLFIPALFSLYYCSTLVLSLVPSFPPVQCFDIS